MDFDTDKIQLPRNPHQVLCGFCPQTPAGRIDITPDRAHIDPEPVRDGLGLLPIRKKLQDLLLPW